MREIKKRKETLPEKNGEAIGDVFKSVVKILDVVQEMERKGESERFYKKEVKGFTKSGEELQGKAVWRVKTGLLSILPPEKRVKKK